MKTHTTPAGKQLEIKEALTGRELRDLKHVEQSTMTLTVDMTIQKPVVNKVSMAEVEIAKEEAIIRKCVVSYDGSTDNVLDRLLDGVAGEYEFALEKASELLQNPKGQK